MRTTSFTLLTIVAIFGLSSATAFAQEHKPGGHENHAEAANLPSCPVTGESIDFLTSVESDDGPVYFCCKMCVKKYKADPAKFAEKVAEQRAALAKLPKVQVACPLSGEPIDKKQFVENDGQKVYFCCASCKGKYAADPSKYQAKLAASYTYQTKCPVMGKEIDPTVSTKLPGGQTVYFCCPGCEGKLAKDAEKYAKNLQEQGYNIKPEDITGKAEGDEKP